MREIAGYLEILGSRARLFEIMRRELLEIKEQFANPRRTTIEDLEFEADIEALIQREDMVVTVSHGGYIKRVPLSTYRAQGRGGRGRSGMAMREEDFVSQVFVASTHTPVLFFTSTGRVYKLKVYRLPIGTPQARGKAMVNLLPNLTAGEGISTVMPLPEDEASWAGYTVVFATRNGYVRRNTLSDFAEVKTNGKIAMKFEGEDADDRLIGVAVGTDTDDVLLATANGRAIRFPIDDIRVFVGRASVGVRGIRLLGDDTVISMASCAIRRCRPKCARRISQSVDVRWARTAPRLQRVRATIHSSRGRWRGGVHGGCSDADRRAIQRIGSRRADALSVTENGFGMRTSAYDYRITGRGGQGVLNVARVRTPRQGRRGADRRQAGPDHSRDRWRDGHSHARPGHPHRAPQQAGRRRLQGRRRRARRIRRPARRHG